MLEYILSFNEKSRPRSYENKNKKNDVFDSAGNLYDDRVWWMIVLRAFKSVLFPLKSIKGTGLKILTPKQMLQRLPIALAQVKAGNNSQSLLNEVKQIVYLLYQSNEIT